MKREEGKKEIKKKQRNKRMKAELNLQHRKKSQKKSIMNISTSGNDISPQRKNKKKERKDQKNKN